MMYYTFTGNYKEIVQILTKMGVFESGTDNNDISDFSKVLILITQRDTLPNDVYILGKQNNTEEQHAQLLISNNSYYSIKIAKIIFELLVTLFKLSQLCQDTLSRIETVVELGYKLYSEGIQKLDHKTYCVYKKLLQLAKEEKKLTVSNEQLVDRTARIEKCDTDLPHEDRCAFIGSDGEQCSLTDSELQKVLESLETMQLIRLNNSSIRVFF